MGGAQAKQTLLRPSRGKWAQPGPGRAGSGRKQPTWAERVDHSKMWVGRGQSIQALLKTKGGQVEAEIQVLRTPCWALMGWGEPPRTLKPEEARQGQARVRVGTHRGQISAYTQAPGVPVLPTSPGCVIGVLPARME